MLTARVIKLHNLGPLLVFAVLSYGVLFEPQFVARRELNNNMADMLTHCLVKCKFKDSIMRAQNFQQYKARGACVYKPLFRYTMYCS